ncbi:MAG: hypothetical protein AB4352_15650 [Hormoscilla sp.]
MQQDLADLQITEKEVESLSGLAWEEGLVGNFYSGGGVKLLPKQLLAFALTLIISLPLALLLTKNSSYGPEDSQAIAQLAIITLGLSFLLTLGWNIYMWRKAKPLKTLARLLDEVDKFARVIKAVDIIDKLTAAGNMEANLINREEVMDGLRVTRDSLTSALQTERILRENQDFISNHYQLFANLENHLAALMALEVNNQASEYGRLLNEALEIGMSVQREMRKLQ